MNLAGLWDQLVDAVCRPPRDDAYTDADLVGGRRAAFRLYQRRYYRQDIALDNGRGQRLQCSHYRPCVTASADGRLPCVIYLHCNSGSRRDAEEILFHLLPKGITIFAFDFAGSGLSDGGFVSLGAHEVDDLQAVVAYLREEGSTSTIGLWGRSMGAVTALLFGQRDPSVAGMVLDSPFSRLVDLMLELATSEQQLRIPKPLIKMAISLLKRSVRKRAGFSVDAVAPLDAVGASFIPALFGHAAADTFVASHHSQRLHQAYAGDKNLVLFEGDHNSIRPDHWYTSAMVFLLTTLRVEELVGPWADLDLSAAPVDALPHLRARGNTIYVTASNGAEQAQHAGSGPGSGAASGGSSGAASPRGAAVLQRSHGSRTLRPPWSLGGHGGGEQPLGAHLTSLEQLGEGLGGGLVAEMGALSLSEEEALQRALELSLQDVRGQQQGGEPGAAAGVQPAAQEGAQDEEDEDAAMLAAAIAASLADQAAAGSAAAAPEAAAEGRAEPGGARGAADAPLAAAAAAEQGDVPEVPAERAAGWGAAQAVADAHAAAEAAAVRAPSRELQHAMSDAAQAAARAAQDGRADWEP